MYFFLLLIFAVLLYTKEEISDLQSIVSMLLCRAFERSNNPYLEPIKNLVFLRIRKRSFLCAFEWEENAEKGLRQWAERGICVFVRVWERKKTALKLL